MVNLLITWIIIGAFIGFSANFLELFSTKQKFFVSVFLGIAGAASGGALGAYATYLSSTVSYISPMLYSIIGAIILSILPIRNRLF